MRTFACPVGGGGRCLEEPAQPPWRFWSVGVEDDPTDPLGPEPAHRILQVLHPRRSVASDEQETFGDLCSEWAVGDAQHRRKVDDDVWELCLEVSHHVALAEPVEDARGVGPDSSGRNYESVGEGRHTDDSQGVVSLEPLAKARAIRHTEDLIR